MRTPEVIYADIQREQEKLSRMDRQDPETLRQSCLVDELINEYYQSLSVYHKSQRAS